MRGRRVAPLLLCGLLSAAPAAAAAVPDSGGTRFSWEGRAFLGLVTPGADPDKGAERAGFLATAPLRLGPLEFGVGIALYAQSVLQTRAESQEKWRGFWDLGWGLPQAFARLPFGMQGWSAAVQAGIFPWKANPDAAFLGEYLARYGTYATRINRGPDPWDSLGAAAIRARGLRFDAASPGGRWRHQALALEDPSLDGKAMDFSLLYVADASFPGGWEVGAGAEWSRFASTQPDGLAPRAIGSGYVKTDSGYVMVYDLPDDAAPGTPVDTSYFTAGGFKLSLRAALDIRELLGWAAESGRAGRAGRLFVEAAWLGVRNQPIFYEDPWRRMAFMGGVHLPSGGFLDDFCLQAEWHRPHLDHGRVPGNGSWVAPQGWAPAEPGGTSAGFLVSKTVWTRLALQAQWVRVLDWESASDNPYEFRRYGSGGLWMLLHI